MKRLVYTMVHQIISFYLILLLAQLLELQRFMVRTQSDDAAIPKGMRTHFAIKSFE